MSKPTPPEGQAQRQGGRVYLVGAGPGDPGLITQRAVHCLRRADVVLYDYLVNPGLLRHAPTCAERVCLGRHGSGRIMGVEEVCRRMVDAAREGRTVVRLKSGDPMIFGRAAEEIAALRTAGIPLEIVPGVTAALAIASYAGVPLTNRDMASAVALVTGQQKAGESFAAEDYASLARFPGTLVFYMGITTAEEWSRGLIAHGKPADTPALVVRRCSLPDQETFRCTLGSLAGELRNRRVRPPAVIAIGPAVGAEAVAEWFTERPLFGRRVLVTRPANAADPLVERLMELGADVLQQPAISIEPPVDWGPVDAAIDRLDEFDWLVFSSRHGVQYFLDRLLERGRDLRSLGGVRIAAIGPGTEQSLRDFLLKADTVPPVYRAESLVETLAPHAAGKRFLLLRASRGRDVLPEGLRAAGAAVTEVVVYQSDDVQRPDEEILRQLESGQIDYVTVTSSAIARSLKTMFGQSLRTARLVSISPVTSATLREAGFEPAVEAARYTMDGVVEAILSDASSRG